MDVSNLKELVEKTKKLKVLYVEDNEATREQALKIFGNFFDYIDVAVDGIEGVELYKKKKNKFYDLVISDINMPNMDGAEMSKSILEIDHHQNILILSAYNDSEQLQDLIDIGISNYIHKPVRMDTLVSALQKTVEALEQQRKDEDEFNEIQKLNHELDALVDSFDTYVIASRTDLKGVITYASRAYEQISGYAKDELIGKPHNIVRHPDMPASAFKQMWNTIQSGKLWVGEVKNLKKDGGFYWVEAHIAPYYNGDGEHVGYSAIRLNITSRKRAELLNEEVTNLLNNAGQGFLSFGADLKIDESFSKECLNIFNSVDLFEQNISDMLFSNNSIKKDLFCDGISRILDTKEDMIKEVFLSLLPKENIINDKDIKIEYKLLPNGNFMLVLTDITNTNRLEEEIKSQSQIQKMIVAIASNKNDFIELKLDFENFISNPTNNLKVLLRELHTYKGVFVQKEMVNIVYGIHALETKINQAVQINNKNMNDILELFQNYNLKKIFQKDLEIIQSVLGEKFLEASCSLMIDVTSLDSLELKLKKLASDGMEDIFEDIFYDFERFRYELMYDMLSIYPLSIKSIAQKLEKEIYPVEILGDKNLKINHKYKLFTQSLIHLFNNCVDHGIEDTDIRVENGKDEIGTIKCSYEHIDNNLQIIISDDGAGINIDKLTMSAIQNGIKTENEIDAMSDDEKLSLVFLDSLSTKDKLSTVSGRGIGMSAIKSEIEKLNGKIVINNSNGSGVEFIFLLPIN